MYDRATSNERLWGKEVSHARLVTRARKAETQFSHTKKGKASENRNPERDSHRNGIPPSSGKASSLIRRVNGSCRGIFGEPDIFSGVCCKGRFRSTLSLAFRGHQRQREVTAARAVYRKRNGSKRRIPTASILCPSTVHHSLSSSLLHIDGGQEAVLQHCTLQRKKWRKTPAPDKVIFEAAIFKASGISYRHGFIYVFGGGEGV